MSDSSFLYSCRFFGPPDYLLGTGAEGPVFFEGLERWVDGGVLACSSLLVPQGSEKGKMKKS